MNNTNNGIILSVSADDIMQPYITNQSGTWYYDVIECDSIGGENDGYDNNTVIYTGTVFIVASPENPCYRKEFDVTDIIVNQRWRYENLGVLSLLGGSNRVNLMNRYYIHLYKDAEHREEGFSGWKETVYLYNQYGNFNPSMSPVDNWFEYNYDETDIPLLAPLVQGNRFEEKPILLPRIPFVNCNIVYPLVCLSSYKYNGQSWELKGEGHLADGFWFPLNIYANSPTYVQYIGLSNLYNNFNIVDRKLIQGSTTDKFIFKEEESVGFVYNGEGETEGSEVYDVQIPNAYTNAKFRVTLIGYKNGMVIGTPVKLVDDISYNLGVRVYRESIDFAMGDAAQYILSLKEMGADKIRIEYELWNGLDYETKVFSRVGSFDASWLLNENNRSTNLSITTASRMITRTFILTVYYESSYWEDIPKDANDGISVKVQKEENYTYWLWEWDMENLENGDAEEGYYGYDTITNENINPFKVYLIATDSSGMEFEYLIGEIFTSKLQQYTELEISQSIWLRLRKMYEEDNLNAVKLLIRNYDMSYEEPTSLWLSDLYFIFADSDVYEKYVLKFKRNYTIEDAEPHTHLEVKLVKQYDVKSQIFNVDLGIDTCISKYYLCWQDRAGGFQCQPFSKTSTFSEDIKRNEWATYQNAKRLGSVEVTNKWELNSEWIPDEHIPYYESIMVSPAIFLWDLDNDMSYRVTVKDNSWTEKNFRNQGRKLNNLQLTVIEDKPQQILY